MRVPGERQFYINAFDKTFEEMRLQDIAALRGASGLIASLQKTTLLVRNCSIALEKMAPELRKYMKSL